MADKLTREAKDLLDAYGVTWVDYGTHILVDDGGTCMQLDEVSSINDYAASIDDIAGHVANDGSWTHYCESVACAAHTHMHAVEAAQGLAGLRDVIDAVDRRDIAAALRIGSAGA